MGGNVVPFNQVGCGAGNALKSRLLNLCAVFSAIHAGELLSALPECASARENYSTAVRLLAFVESEIQAICLELD